MIKETSQWLELFTAGRRPQPRLHAFDDLRQLGSLIRTNSPRLAGLVAEAAGDSGRLARSGAQNGAPPYAEPMPV
jgi:hypothetical protein